jgi:hypothetical protein
MSTRDALIEKIQQQPEWVLKEVDLYLEFLTEKQKSPKKGSGAWPKGYFEETAGAFANELFERPPQLPFEKREEW